MFYYNTCSVYLCYLMTKLIKARWANESLGGYTTLNFNLPSFGLSLLCTTESKDHSLRIKIPNKTLTFFWTRNTTVCLPLIVRMCTLNYWIIKHLLGIMWFILPKSWKIIFSTMLDSWSPILYLAIKHFTLKNCMFRW